MAIEPNEVSEELGERANAACLWYDGPQVDVVAILNAALDNPQTRDVLMRELIKRGACLLPVTNELYGITFSLSGEKVVCQQPQPVYDQALDKYSKEEIKKNGFVILLEPSLPTYSFVGPHPIVYYFCEMFLFGAASILVEDKKEFFKKFVLNKYDQTIDYLDEINEDPISANFPYKNE